MAKFRKRVSAPGAYVTPDGPATVTPARIKHWHDTIQRLLADGIKIPLSWGHLSTSIPHSEDDAQFWAARGVAGKVTGSEIDPRTGELIVAGESPGVEMTADGALVSLAEGPDGRRYRTSIEEVSLGVRDWTDGQGRVWKDAPVHVAVTPLPVWVPEGGQPPFEPADADAPGQQRFGFGNLLYRFGSPPMAEEKDDKGGDAPAAGGVNIKKVLEKLAAAGIALPDDTTPENLLERLWVACTAVGGGGAEPPPATTPPDEGGAGGTFMSTYRNDPFVRRLVADNEAAAREKRLTRIAALKKRGLSEAQAKKYREEASALRFSADGKPASLDERLDALESALPPEDVYDGLTRSATPHAGVREVEPPEGGGGTAKKYRELADLQAKNGRLPARR